jgi:hypothetical protein
MARARDGARAGGERGQTLERQAEQDYRDGSHAPAPTKKQQRSEDHADPVRRGEQTVARLPRPEGLPRQKDQGDPVQREKGYAEKEAKDRDAHETVAGDVE